MSNSRVEDELAISRVIQEVARAYDLMKHEEILPRVFEPKARQHYYIMGNFLDFSMPQGIAIVKAYHDRCHATQHLVAPPVIVFDGDTARTESPVHAVHVQIRHDGSRSTWILGGYYHDTLVKHPEGWRIRERICYCTHEIGEFLQDVRLFPSLPDYREPA
jgi:hypothetical protein